MKHLLAVLFVALALLVGPVETMGQELNDSQQPGSVLVFHKFQIGTVADPEQGTLPTTEFEISVSCPVGEVCPGGQVVNLKAHWVCPGGAGRRCLERDFRLRTTVNGTLFFNPENIAPTNVLSLPTPPCSAGYLIVWAVDNQDRPIKFDGLIGNAVFRPAASSVGAYNALPIQAVSALANLALISLGQDGALVFDGRDGHYSALTGTIFGTVRYPKTVPPANHIDTFLTLLTLDVKSNRFNFPTIVDLNFFKPNEELVSDSVEFTCWAELNLLNIDLNLSEVFMGRKGLVESVNAVKVPIFGVDDKAGPVTLFGVIDTEEFSGSVSRREYMYLLYNDGEPVATTFEPNP
jgi:hypothetical protein